MRDGFAFLDEVAPGIRWDAKYATWDNFTARPVDGYDANRIVGTVELCRALRETQRAAATHGLGLLVWDGYRPQRAVDRFVRWAAEPEDERTKHRHHPRIDRRSMFELGYVAERSGHSRGSTVDLTMFDLRSGDLVPMGGDHDLMDAISHHEADGVPAAAAGNRRTLRALMEDGGFVAYEAEWWHYTLADEPYPDTLFDFPVRSVPRTRLTEPGHG
jgi:D-alanyl-D-alanine dipeptidase